MINFSPFATNNKLNISIASLAVSMCLFTVNPLVAQTISSSAIKGAKWTSSPYEDKVFIENRGQFDGKDKWSGSQIYYGADNKGTQLFFTRKGLTYRYDEKKVKRNLEPENKKEGSKTDAERKREMEERILTTTYFLTMEWLNANPNVSILTENKVSQYWNYETNIDNQGLNNVPAFEKIIYKNLYPNIDVEYTFHAKEGIKYNLILHPGADVSKVKMKYNGSDKINVDQKGNVHFNYTSLGDVIDHAPVSFYKDGNAALASSFVLDGNVVSFKIQDHDNSKTVIIDPWVINPAFSGGTNKAYDITKDVTGNVYIYGGTQNQYECKKYTSAGALTWTFSAAALGQYYGDMALDFTGNAYLSSGCCNGGRLIKLNPAGAIVYNVAGSGISEMWRMAQDCNYSKLVGGGGAYGYIADINKTTGILSNVTNLSSAYELRSYAVDPVGNIYSLTVTMGNTANVAGNQVIKSAPNFTTTYSVNSNYNLEEYGVYYTSINFAGFSGIVIDNNFIYTYDGATIYKRNIVTGASVGNVSVLGGITDQNGGIYLDGCSNIYVGTQGSIRKYSPTLTFMDSVITTGAVYDIVMGINNEVLACGDGFVASFAGLAPCLPQLNIANTATNTGCGNSIGTATASVSGGTGAYTYSWSNGQTTATTTGLSAGTYTVTVTDFNGCNGGINTQTVNILSGGGTLNLASSQTNILCNGGANGSASVTASNGNGTLTYSWTPSGQTKQTATGLGAGIYTVTVTDSSGCASIQTVVVTEPLALAVSANGDSICEGESFTLNATSTGGTGTVTYTWNPGNLIGNGIVVSPTSTTNYTVTATDANGCTKTRVITVVVSPSPTASFTATPNTGQVPLSVVFTNTSTGGTSYSWIFGDGNTANTFNAANTYLVGGTYNPMLIVTNSSGCKDTVTVTIVADGFSSLIVPNVFSPNGDGNNETFFITTVGIKDMTVTIYDRWGLLMSTVTGVVAGWDGKSANGKDASEGTYYYVLHANGIDNKEYNLKGYLTLLRK